MLKNKSVKELNKSKPLETTFDQDEDYTDDQFSPKFLCTIYKKLFKF